MAQDEQRQNEQQGGAEQRDEPTWRDPAALPREKPGAEPQGELTDAGDDQDDQEARE